MADRIRRAYPPPAKCGAKARSTGKPCGRWATPGGTRCPNHGGYAGRNGRARAGDLHAVGRLESLVTTEAERQMQAMGYPAALVASVSTELAGGGTDWREEREALRRAEADLNDEERLLVEGTRRGVARAVERFQAALAEMAGPQAQEVLAAFPAAEGAPMPAVSPLGSQPAVSPLGSQPAVSPPAEPAPVVVPEPEPAPAAERSEADPITEAEDLTLNCQSAVTSEPAAEPAEDVAETVVEPRFLWDEERQIKVRNPAFQRRFRDADRQTTTLGIQSTKRSLSSYPAPPGRTQ